MYEEDDVPSSPEDTNSPHPGAAAAVPAVRNESITSAQGRDVEHVLAAIKQTASSKDDVIRAGAEAHDIQLLRQLGDTVQRQAAQNRVAVQGVAKFAQSVHFLSEKLARGPTSESGIKKLEIGLTTQIVPPPPSGAPQAASEESETQQQQQQQQTQTQAVLSVASPLRENFVRVGEALFDIARLLEQIEAQSGRALVARRRREMLMGQRERLLQIASKRKIDVLPAGSAGGHRDAQHHVAAQMMLHG